MEHSSDMPRSRKVVVDFTIRMITDEHYDEESINFRYNEGCWCADSLLDQIEYWKERTRSTCICPLTTGKYVREATEKDVEVYEKGGCPE